VKSHMGLMFISAVTWGWVWCGLTCNFPCYFVCQNVVNLHFVWHDSCVDSFIQSSEVWNDLSFASTPTCIHVFSAGTSCIRDLGYDGGEDVSRGLVGCDAVWFCRRLPTFRRNLSPWSFRVWDVEPCSHV
jgi:hypothetical protein